MSTKNRGRGRPRTRPKRLVSLRLDVTPAEAVRIRKAAAICGGSQSSFARLAVVSRARAILGKK